MSASCPEPSRLVLFLQFLMNFMKSITQVLSRNRRADGVRKERAKEVSEGPEGPVNIRDMPRLESRATAERPAAESPRPVLLLNQLVRCEGMCLQAVHVRVPLDRALEEDSLRLRGEAQGRRADAVVAAANAASGEAGAAVLGGRHGGRGSAEGS